MFELKAVRARMVRHPRIIAGRAFARTPMDGLPLASDHPVYRRVYYGDSALNLP